MKKCLMSVMAAVALGGMFTGCTKDADLSGGQNSAEFNIVQNYENAFITRFGQPAANQTWGFGSASAGTRAVVGQPSVSRIGYSFNATMTMGANAASAAGLDAGSYSIWAASGWEDEVYQVNGTVDPSNISSKLKAAIVNKIVGTDANPGLIPEGSNNLGKANELGYSVVTKERGPVTLTPVYHQSSSGDPIYYYYYQKGTNPDVKKLKKYSIGYMADPNVCKDNINALNENTYSLVYEDENGNVSYDFPPNMVISFIVSNVDYKYPSTPVDVYEPGATSLTSQGQYLVEANQTIKSGTKVENVISNKLDIRYGNSFKPTQFSETKAVDNPFKDGDTEYTHIITGNGTNGTLNGGSTCYYFKANETGELRIGLRRGNNDLLVYDIGTEWNGTGMNPVTPLKKSPDKNSDGICAFDVTQGHVYAVYEKNGKLGYFGYTFKEETKPLFGGLPSYDCGTVFDSSIGANKINVMLGKGDVYFDKTQSDNHLEEYSARTNGTGINGGFRAGATIYYFKPKEAGVLSVGVAIPASKTLNAIDLGEDGWDNTEGRTVKTEANGNSYTIYKNFDFDVEANHVYAVYASGSKASFYGCEFLTESSSAGGKRTIENHPEFYGDGNYNTAIHTSGLGWTVNPSTTPHAAVFNTELTDEDGKKVKVSLIGFEDWTDLDFNDVIFAVTGAEPEVEQPPVIIEVPDDPEGFVCRIIVEDLTVGESSDFDFNDVVFDVYKNGTLIIRAIGGELPIYIGAEGANEVHAACDVTLPANFNNNKGQNSHMVMRNTGWASSGSGKTNVAIDYNADLGHISLNRTFSSKEDAKNIGIWVHKNGTNIRLQAPVGKVASMICVGQDYKWCAERQDIDDKYHKDGVKLFHQYVIGDPNYGDDWEHKNAWYQKLDQ